SEHFMQGVQYPLEIHFVHYNAKYTSLTDAVSSGKPHALLVIGQFFQMDQGIEPAALQQMGNEASRATSEGVVMNVPINLNNMINTADSYYSYAGSLTTPTCNEIVTWVVLQTPRTVSKATMDK
ncbi:hypothetical protein GUITHDRAFT_43812, partial [Guillardia theta CCMP2712]